MKKTRLRKDVLGDFSATTTMVPMSLLAILIGLIGTGLAWVLLRLIGFFTNVFYYGRLSSALVSPAGNHLGWWAMLIPSAGGLIVGMMAFYGSERIRGHGIPEALESILLNGSKMQPQVAILKPISSAISIGSGGPFGAEGPIIMTGGAMGSIVAQLLKLTAAERKTLLVAGAAAGMSATFATPVAAVLLAVELLLFEWKPRSAIPVAIASATAGIARRYVLGIGPLFVVPAHLAFIGPAGIAGCVVAGLLAGGLAMAMTYGVYAAEDGFHRLPVHWKWWPAIGGIFVGLGGMVFPRALGVGYDVIQDLVQGRLPMAMVAAVLFVKAGIWIVSLGSGTSGGVLAPLLMTGAALGGLESMFLPNEGAGFWPLVSMAAVLSGTMGAPFTAIVFALELTNDVSVLLPLLVAGMLAHAVTVLVLKRSILTEKIARRGVHLSREYATDPLEVMFVHEVLKPKNQTSMPVTDVVAHPDEPLRAVVFRMAESGMTELPVLDRETEEPMGVVRLHDMLAARVRGLKEERLRERILRLRLPAFRTARRARL